MFCGPFDADLAASGPPAVFLPDRDGALRFDADWTRDTWNHAELAGDDPSTRGAWRWVLLRDHATGYVTLLLATGPHLVRTHPRGTPQAWATRELAEAARAAFGNPPIGPVGP
jgi:uncharacterized protein YbjT (DUF2867 family)